MVLALATIAVLSAALFLFGLFVGVVWWKLAIVFLLMAWAIQSGMWLRLKELNVRKGAAEEPASA